MRRRGAIIIFAALLLSIASAATGFVIGGSNLGFLGYTAFSQIAPSKPYVKDQWAAQNYEQEVRSYRNAAIRYIEDANNDIKRIREEANNAARKADSVTDEYNNWVRTGY